MSFSVDKVAELAYLKLSAEEKSAFQTQFEQILKYVGQLQAIPMTETEAKEMGEFHISSAFYKELGLDPSATLRGDEDSESTDIRGLNLKNEEALSNAPKTGGIPGELLFEVPSIIERD